MHNLISFIFIAHMLGISLMACQHSKVTRPEECVVSADSPVNEDSLRHRMFEKLQADSMEISYFIQFKYYVFKIRPQGSYMEVLGYDSVKSKSREYPLMLIEDSAIIRGLKSVFIDKTSPVVASVENSGRIRSIDCPLPTMRVTIFNSDKKDITYLNLGSYTKIINYSEPFARMRNEFHMYKGAYDDSIRQARSREYWAEVDSLNQEREKKKQAEAVQSDNEESDR